MTMPRQVVPGRDYMITRRCSERRFFLRPDEETNQTFLYCLALAAQRAKVNVHFFNALSNHYHAGIHDAEGNYPVFLEHFQGLEARSQNAHLGRFENFWSSEPTSVVHLVEPSDILEKMVYTYTNPAAADLVNTIEEWPGANSFRASLFDEEIVITRPKHFFRSEGNLPLSVTLPISRPRGFENLSREEWADLLTGSVRAKEAEHRERRIKGGIAILGRARILAQDPLRNARNIRSYSYGLSEFQFLLVFFRILPPHALFGQLNDHRMGLNALLHFFQDRHGARH